MADEYDPLPDLAKLLAAALRAGRDGAAYADRIAERLGLGEDDSAEVVAGVLQKALGLAVTGACELVPLKGGTACTHPAVVRLAGACPHGHVAERMVCQEHRTPGEPLWCRACYRLPEPGAHKCPVALFPAGSSVRAVTPGQVPSAPKTYYPCCIHCEHDGETDPDLDDERHPNPCPDGCHAARAVSG